MKRTFVLFEVLIALALVGGAILPFLRYPYAHMRKELDLLFQMELEKMASKTLVDLEESLYKNEVPPEFLFGEKSKKVQYNEAGEKVRVELSSKIGREFNKKIFIHWEKQKIDKDQNIWTLVKLEVEFYSLKDKKNSVMWAESEIVATKEHIQS